MSDKLSQLICSINEGQQWKSVDLTNADLDLFPEELFRLTDCLEVLNLGGNNLSSLPEGMARFHRLRILFFGQNKFEEIPSALSALPSLYMLSFKSNRIRHIAPESLNSNISWLILTDNLISELPSSIGSLVHLRKLMLAGNQLKSLPVDLSHCRELELLRISANQLEFIPEWLLELPRLAWFAFAGNPLVNAESVRSEAWATVRKETNPLLPLISWSHLKILDKIGEGASGYIYRAAWSGSDAADASVFRVDGVSRSDEAVPVAVKIFKGATTSDGLPEHEMEATIAMGSTKHPCFTGVLGKLVDTPNHEMGLVFPLIDQSLFKILGNPPSFDSITRDTFPEDKRFSLHFVLRVLMGIASACALLHRSGTTHLASISHGDLYAHNILVQGDGQPLLTDFGAASFKELDKLSARQIELIERIEVRAFGCLIEDLLLRLDRTREAPMDEAEQRSEAMLEQLRAACVDEVVMKRPSFQYIDRALAVMSPDRT